MTSEELIILLDSLQPQLPKCANQVLLRLVAKCIAGGSNEVDISAAELARELGMSEDSVKVAKRALLSLIVTRGGNGTPTIWTLPAEWFVVQRSLFAVPAPVDNLFPRPGNQGAATWKPGHSAPQKPGHSALETRAPATVTRAQWTSFQGASAIETRAVPVEDTENTAGTILETRAASIDRDRALSSIHHQFPIRDSIEGVNWLPEELRSDGEQLKRWLRFFFAKSWPERTVPDGPDEIIAAKCLAIANLSRLQHVLSQLLKKNTKPGDTWAWFVTVFCQRVHGTKELTAVRSPEGFHRNKKNPASEGLGVSESSLLGELTAATRMNR